MTQTTRPIARMFQPCGPDELHRRGNQVMQMRSRSIGRVALARRHPRHRRAMATVDIIGVPARYKGRAVSGAATRWHTAISVRSMRPGALVRETRRAWYGSAAPEVVRPSYGPLDRCCPEILAPPGDRRCAGRGASQRVRTRCTSAWTTGSTRGRGPSQIFRRTARARSSWSAPCRCARVRGDEHAGVRAGAWRSSRRLRRVAAAGVDAVIVQDPAVALMARAVCGELEVHGSTQMTASSGLAVELLALTWASTRVVVPRSQRSRRSASIKARVHDASGVFEVFVHGALCVAWSG